MPLAAVPGRGALPARSSLTVSACQHFPLRWCTLLASVLALLLSTQRDATVRLSDAVTTPLPQADLAIPSAAHPPPAAPAINSSHRHAAPPPRTAGGGERAAGQRDGAGASVVRWSVLSGLSALVTALAVLRPPQSPAAESRPGQAHSVAVSIYPTSGSKKSPPSTHADPATCTVVEGGLVCELVPDNPPDPVEGKVEDEEDMPMLPASSAVPEALGTTLQWALLVSPFFMWGTSMVAMKETLEHTTPLFIAGVRCVPAGLVILSFCAAQGKPLVPKTWRGWGWILGFALVDATMFQGFLAEGLRRTSAGLGSVIIDSQPLTVAVLASLFFGERLGPKAVVGLALGVLGIGLVELAPQNLSDVFFFASSLGLGGGSLWDRGEWWMLLAAQSMAVGTVMVRVFAKDVDPVLATGWHLLLGGIPLFALSAALGGPLADQTALLTVGDWLRLAYVSVFGGAVGYGLFFYAAERGSLTKLSSLTFLTPMFAVLGGYAFLAETLTPIQAVGAAVTLAGIYLINGPK